MIPTLYYWQQTSPKSSPQLRFPFLSFPFLRVALAVALAVALKEHNEMTLALLGEKSKRPPTVG